jgi:signal transduction histidine kinase
MNLVNSKGKSIFTIVSIIPLTNNNGETTGFKVLLNEITELIKFLTLLEDENEAVQEQNAENSKTMFRNTKQAAMGELISMIAHQWRQPLSTISLIVSDLMLKTAFGMYDANYFMNAFKKMEGHVEYMSITIDDFRNFFKPNKQKEIFELGTVLNNAQKIMKDVLENNGVFYKEQSLSGIKLFTYKSELLQVFINLIKNAKDVVVERKITNPYIKVSTKKSKGNVIIVFEDNAGGIPLKIIDKIFEPYFSTKDEKNGTGLGLSMSKTIIEDHMGGKIKVSNTVVGAKFEIELPIYVVGNQ